MERSNTSVVNFDEIRKSIESERAEIEQTKRFITNIISRCRFNHIAQWDGDRYNENKLRVQHLTTNPCYVRNRRAFFKYLKEHDLSGREFISPYEGSDPFDSIRSTNLYTPFFLAKSTLQQLLERCKLNDDKFLHIINEVSNREVIYQLYIDTTHEICSVRYGIPILTKPIKEFLMLNGLCTLFMSYVEAKTVTVVLDYRFCSDKTFEKINYSIEQWLKYVVDVLKNNPKEIFLPLLPKTYDKQIRRLLHDTYLSSKED